jgi:endonuclease YncB( thermonuclease family)
MKRQRNASRRSAALTPRQIVILIVFALSGSAALFLAGYGLLGNAPVATRQPQAEPGNASLFPTWTAPARQATHPAPAPTQTQNMPPLPASCAQSGSSFRQGTVLRVIDGSTIQVQDGENVLLVGYAGIEVPQANDPTGSPKDQPAARKARDLLEGKPVVLVKDVSEQDSAGRLLRYVFSGSQFINYELARQGLAEVSSNSPDQTCAAFLKQAEQQARVEGLGIWQSTPVPTRTFVPFVTLDPNQNACDCSIKHLCSDFRTHAEAQACLNLCNDYSSKLDEDRDGIACEDLP